MTEIDGVTKLELDTVKIRAFLYGVGIALGIVLVVSVCWFGVNVKRDLDDQRREIAQMKVKAERGEMAAQFIERQLALQQPRPSAPAIPGGSK